MYGARFFYIFRFSHRRFCGAYDFLLHSVVCSGIERRRRGWWLAFVRFYCTSICLVIRFVSARANSSMAVLADRGRDISCFAVVALTSLLLPKWAI